ncbi:Glycosyltransferase like family [Rhizoctonia solani]|uniref:Glycosyltransferase like family n=1 Tax=Rhizoctonia solani TaxID=456999 RepID=A0A8H7IBW5_9AGAM|nr:Glycosyltransferase like family [Rhizoctonia solani]
MSFADLERGQGGFQSSSALVPHLLPTPTNRNYSELIKRGTDDLKTLSTLQRNLPQHKALLQKTSHDFQVSLVAFQRAQKVSAERQRTVVDGVKQAVEDNANSSGAVASSPQSQRQIQAFQSQISPAELAHQESLIQEREIEIREIETGIHELNEIFRDLGTLVTEQGTMLDTIEANVDSVALDTRDAAQQLEQASEYQRKAGRRAACLMLVVVIVICVVLVAVRIVILSLEFPWFSTRVLS